MIRLTKISIKDLNIKFEDIHAVKDFSVELTDGDFIALVGHNGAGKSTLINTIVGFQAPTSGDVLIEAENIEERGFSVIGFSPQTTMLDWYNNVYDNVYLGTLLGNCPTSEAGNLTEQALKLMNIFDLKDRSLEQLSGGQQQRVQIARALVHRPDIYILDEPTVGMDQETGRELLSYLKEEAAAGKIVIISSHDLSLLEEHCDDLLFMDHGELLYYGEMTTFAQSKDDRDSYEVLFAEDYDLSDEAYQRANKYNYKVEQIEENKVKLTVPKGTLAREVLRVFGKDTPIKSVEPEMISLKEAYLSMREGRES